MTLRSTALILHVLQEAESLEARVDAVRNAIWSRNEDVVDDDNRWYPVDVFDAHVIVRRGRALLQIPYTFASDGSPEFGDPVPVQVEYTPVTVQESVLMAAEQMHAEGIDWDVVILRPGLSLNGLYYSRAVVQAAAALFEGVRAYHFGDEGAEHMRSPTLKRTRHLVGWLDNVQIRESDGCMIGCFHFLQEASVDPVRVKLTDAWRRGKRDMFGLSIDARGKLGAQQNIEGKLAFPVETIQQALSVDVVFHPAAGGEFTRLVASAAPTNPEEGSMLRQRLWALLESRRPTAIAGLDRNTVTLEKLEELAGPELIQEAFAQPAAAPVATTTAAPPAQATPAAPTAQELQEARRDSQLLRTELALDRALQESRLPELVQRRIREQTRDQVLTSEQIQAAIKAERDYLAALNPARPHGLGRSPGDVVVGVSKIDRLQAAMDKSFGLEVAPEFRDVRPIGLRGLYNEITLGHDPLVTGRLTESAVQDMLQEAFTNATLPRVVSNAMHRRLLQDYRAVEYGERRIITIKPGGAPDFKTQEGIRVGYFGDLATVDPETADYAELAAYGEEAATYAVGQKGNIVTVTRKHIINDDVGAFAKISGRLGRAARRTFAQFVWNFWINNGAIYDTVVWFHATHNNLQVAALSVAELNAAELKLFNQTELSAGKKLGLRVGTLVISGDQKAAAIGINQSPQLPGSPNNDINPWFHRFGANNENIIVNPLLTDANDWGVFAPPEDGDVIEVAFLNGQEEPELWIADSPTVGQMFTADKLIFKIRHEYGGAVVDFRTAVKAVVP